MPDSVYSFFTLISVDKYFIVTCDLLIIYYTTSSSNQAIWLVN